MLNTYTADENGQVFAGRFNRPSWVRNKALNTWGVVPSLNTLADINPRNNPLINPVFPNKPEWEATGSFQQIIGAWCGASYNFIEDELRISIPAGHSDYAGGEPYSIRLKTDSPRWEMLHHPTGAIGDGTITNDGQEATGLYANGRARAIHSYNKLVYIPSYGHAAIPQGSTSHGAQNGTTKAVIFDDVTGEMIRFGAEIQGEISGDYSGGAAVYDESRQSVWVRKVGSGRFHRYHVPSDTWIKDVSDSIATSGSNGLEYIPEHDCILWLNNTFNSRGEIAVLNCQTGEITRKQVGGIPVGLPLNGQVRPRLFDTNKFACWNNSSETTKINVLSFDTNPISGNWNVSQLNVSAENTIIPTTATGNGTYGRFFYSKNLGIFGVVNGVTQPIYFYRYK